MNTRKSLLCMVASWFATAAGAATVGQSCDTANYPMSAPTERFADNRDGTVTDNGSGLMWMRCALGQSWTGKTCTGAPLIHGSRHKAQQRLSIPMVAMPATRIGACRISPSWR
jgi:hypothetical protein